MVDQPMTVGDDGFNAAAARFDVAVTDSRRAIAYLVAPGSDDYIAIMAVLEASITDMTPTDVAAAVRAAGRPLGDDIVQDRLDKLREWQAASARTDFSRIRRHADIRSRNWGWTATPAGRQVQRFYTTVLAGTPTMREIPLSSLARIVDALETLTVRINLPPVDDKEIAEQVGRLFTSHDDLDAALVGAEDTLATLADRFDLDHDATAELKGLLVDYATRVAAELESGAAQAHRILQRHLQPHFATLASISVNTSDARALIERGALTASKGGRVEDWAGLLRWCDPDNGRSARFALRLVRALPGMHANLRRLHTSTGAATDRTRALTLARACANQTYGTAILLAALGDHPWRKLYGEADDTDLTRNPPWRAGPTAAVPDLLRSTGRTGARGRPPAARDDTAARAEVAARREQRAAEHAEALQEVLAAAPGARLSPRAARVALASLMAAVRASAAGPDSDRRAATCDGLTCTLFHTGTGTGAVNSPTWRVLLPGREPVFHLPGARPVAPGHTTPDRAARAVAVFDDAIEGAA